jgi:hypothetical protein
MALLFLGVVGGNLRSRMVTAKKIDTTGVWLSGIDAAYRNELPAGPENLLAPPSPPL